MIEELNEEPLHVCVGYAPGKPPLYVAHCLELDLIGEGQTKPKEVSCLKQLIEIQYRIYEDNNEDLPPNDVHDQWRVFHENADYPKEDNLIIQKHGNVEGETVVLTLKIDKHPGRVIRNTDLWPSEYSLSDLEAILREKGISFERVSDRPQYGYFLGRWGADSDGSLQLYPLYAPDGMHIRWYHLRSIALRFGLDCLRSDLKES